MNTDIEITFNDIDFARKQKSNFIIRKMISFITVRNLKIIQHQCENYVILFIYFTNIDIDNKFVKTFIERKIHFIKNLKINMFIDNDIIVFKNILIDFKKQKIIVRNCDITISFEIRLKIIRVQIRSIYAKKEFVIFFRTQLVVVINDLNNNLTFDCDFLFESNDIELILYVHLIDFFIKIIFVTNNIDQFIKISRNFKLKKLMKLDYIKVFLI